MSLLRSSPLSSLTRVVTIEAGFALKLRAGQQFTGEQAEARTCSFVVRFDG
jgi:hypothetical protein